jgi:hypothetical protein
MTETEDRLTDALHAAARSVTAAGLRPLDEARAPRPSPADPRTRRDRWLAAVASAAAVVLIAGVVVAVSARLRTASEAAGQGMPRYYAEISLVTGRVLIRATATGRVTAVVPDPARQGQFQNVTTADDRTFFADFSTKRHPALIYRFRVTPAGRVSHLTSVPGGNLGRYFAVAMAVSPSGSQLALAENPDILVRGRVPQRVVLLSTRTGARTIWAGGPPPPGMNPRSASIAQLSWTANGRELVYLGYWTCARRHSDLCAKPGLFGDYGAVRTLNPAGPGGSLTSGRLLFRANNNLGAAAISPDGSVLTAVRLRQRHGSPRQRMIVTQYDARTGRQLRVLYSFGTSSASYVWSLVPGPAGRYLIVVGTGMLRGPAAGTVNGWIAGGRLHRLRPAGADVSGEAW